MEEGDNGIRVDIRINSEEQAIRLPLVGRHNASNAVAALAVAREAGVPLAAAIQALETLAAGDKRGEVLRLSGQWAGVTIINDSYNSNPEALKSMILALAAYKVDGAGRRILVAGEMLELGDYGPALHQSCGEAAAAAGIDVVVGVQGNAQHLVRAVTGSRSQAVFVADSEAAGNWLRGNLRAGDVVLVKGSRGVRLERAVAAVEG